MRKIVYAVVSLVTLICLGLSQGQVFAEDPLNQACTGNGSSSSICKDRTDKNPLTGTDGTLYKITLIISIISGIIAVIMIMISGFRYITSGGDTQKISSAKNTLIGSIIGLVIIAVSQTIITFVLSKI